MRHRSRSSSPAQKAYLTLQVPACLHDCVDEVYCYLVVAFRGKGSENLSLLAAAHCRVLQNFAELRSCLNDLAEMG